MQTVIFNAKSVMFATGGYARSYKINSNAHANTGDGLSIVARHGLPLEDMEIGRASCRERVCRYV